MTGTSTRQRTAFVSIVATPDGSRLAVYKDGVRVAQGPELDPVELLQALGIEAAFYTVPSGDVDRNGNFPQSITHFSVLTEIVNDDDDDDVWDDDGYGYDEWEYDDDDDA